MEKQQITNRTNATWKRTNHKQNKNAMKKEQTPSDSKKGKAQITNATTNGNMGK